MLASAPRSPRHHRLSQPAEPKVDAHDDPPSFHRSVLASSASDGGLASWRYHEGSSVDHGGERFTGADPELLVGVGQVGLTVRRVRKRAWAISGLLLPLAARRATRRSLGVSASGPLSRSRRGRAPVASSSCRARFCEHLGAAAHRSVEALAQGLAGTGPAAAVPERRAEVDQRSGMFQCCSGCSEDRRRLLQQRNPFVPSVYEASGAKGNAYGARAARRAGQASSSVASSRALAQSPREAAARAASDRQAHNDGDRLAADSYCSPQASRSAKPSESAFGRSAGGRLPGAA